MECVVQGAFEAHAVLRQSYVALYGRLEPTAGLALADAAEVYQEPPTVRMATARDESGTSGHRVDETNAATTGPAGNRECS
jgi:hypothetical protein